MKRLIFTWALVFVGFTTLAQNTGHLLEQYMDVKNALVSGNSQTTAETATILHQSLKNDETTAKKADLLTTAEELSKAKNIEKQREAFGELSTAIWALVKRSGKPAQTVYYQYCPMKKAYWLSFDKAIKNPYYGASMLTCGKVAETHS